MKFMSRIFTCTFSFLMVVALSTDLLQGQNVKTEATRAYNNALELAQNQNFIDAIDLYMEARELATSPDCEDCSELAQMATNQIPRVHYSRASHAFQQFQQSKSVEAVDDAIEYFQDAQEAGEEFGDDQVRDRSRSVIPQLYYNKSLVQYNSGNHEGALESLNRAIELNANYTLAYYQRGIVLNNTDGVSLEEAIDAFDQAIEVGERVGDSENVGRAQRRVRAELVYQAVQRMDNNQRTQAIELLHRAEEYQPNHVDVNYRLAQVYNERGNWEQAATYANRALQQETGGVADRAKIYFELGLAYQGQGTSMKQQACNAFENAAYGEFQGPAHHKLEYELECEGYASANGQ
ncbi:MAG: tetratricopeptide repeat protein [Balneolaceae bacterium]